MQRKTAPIDLTRGPIIPLALRFALPLCVGAVLQQLYSTVDMLVIGNYCGATALAAVGTSSQPVEMFLCLFMGLGTGVTILVSQCTGSGNQTRLRVVVRNATTFLYLCALPLTVLGVAFGPAILRLMQAPADTWDMAVRYIRIIFLGTLGNLGYNVNAGILRGVGDSRASLLFLVISCVVNIALDWLLVAGLGMNVSGAAWATIAAMYVSWVISMVYISRRYPDLGYSPLPRSADRHTLLEILRVSLPLGLNHSVYSVGHLFLQTLINAQGSVFMAGCSVGSKVNSLANVAIGALSSAGTTFAGQNLGANRYDRLARGGWQIPLFSGFLTLCAGVAVTVFAQPILRLFNDDPDVLTLALRFVRIVLPSLWTFAIFNGIIAFVNGMGIMTYPTAVNVLALWAVRIPVAYLIDRFWDGQYVMVSFPVSFVFGMTAMLCYFLSHRWREVRRKARQQREASATLPASAGLQ
ncbi:MAG: MATE family efflux transporter [Aristaeellaceae bacterium]